MKKITYLLACISALIITSCKKGEITQLSVPATGVQVKFIHAAPGLPAVDGYINGTKVTPQGIAAVTDNLVPTSVVTGYTYLNVFPGSNYSVSTAGSTVIKIVASTPVPALVSPQTAAPGAVLGNITQNTSTGQAYSVFTFGLQGSVATPLITKVVLDNFPDAVAGKGYIRFADFIPNGTAALDITGTYTPTGGVATTVTLATAVSYGNLTDFIAVNVNTVSTTSYTLQAYYTGTTTKVGGTLALSVTPGRYYTVFARGLGADYPVPSTSITLKSTARPTLPVTDNATRFPEIYFNVPGLTFYTNK